MLPQERTPLNKPFDLTGRGAVVTGGATGIGFGIAYRLAEAGAGVLIADINKEAAQESASKLASYGFKAEGAGCDVTRSDQVRNAIDMAVSTMGNLSILVNNAGIYPFQPMFEMSEADWDKVIAINLKGSYLSAREVSRTMIEQKRGGCIVNIGSTTGLRPSPFPGLVHYSASKGGVLMLTMSLARELAPHGIGVNIIAPGGIPREQAQTGQAAAPGQASILQRYPLGRMGRPDDIATVALFLASDASSYMTGSLVVADGGYMLS